MPGKGFDSGDNAPHFGLGIGYGTPRASGAPPNIEDGRPLFEHPFGTAEEFLQVIYP